MSDLENMRCGFFNQPDLPGKLRLAFQLHFRVLWLSVPPHALACHRSCLPWCFMACSEYQSRSHLGATSSWHHVNSFFIQTFKPFQDLHGLSKLHFSSDFFFSYTVKFSWIFSSFSDNNQKERNSLAKMIFSYKSTKFCWEFCIFLQAAR